MTIDTVRTANLPTIAYDHAQSPEEAHALIRQACLHGPIAMGRHGIEVLSYELVRIVQRDDRFAMPKGLQLAAQGVTSGELWDKVVTGLLSLDGEAHHRQRRLVSKAFTPKAAARLRTTCTQIISELVDRHAGAGRCDVVADISRQYPIPIICALLGTPRDDWQKFSDWAEDVSRVFDWNIADDGPTVLRAWKALEAHIDDMVTQRRGTLTDDLLSDMMRAEEDGDRLSHDELLTLTAQLLMAGTDTTRNQLAAAIQVFCDHPDQWTLLAEHPELAHRAVEETMRFFPSIFGTMRIAVEDVELGGVMIPAGSIVIPNTAAANRDPAVYPDPDRFDITRENGPSMLTFGGGIHYCLGSHLARIELAEALTVMAQRMPDIRIAGPVPWKPITGISGPISLPVEFGCGS
jgi:cytochrome P450